MKTCTNRPEPLESRIAPARVIDVGVPNNPGDFDYNEAPFVNTETAPGSDLIAAAVGGGLIGAADTFYLRLSAGDEVRLFRFGGGASTEPFLIVNSGNIIAFFTDKNLDNEVQETEITGISMGKGASFELRAALPGDVVANLDEKGTKDLADDALIMGGPGTLVSEKLNVGGIRVGSSVGGSVDEGIVFQTALESVAGGAAVQEVQTFTLTTPTGDVGSTFRLGVGGFTTAPILSTASPDDVRDALNGLANVAAAGGVTVVVVDTDPDPVGVRDGFQVTFNLAGEQTELIKVFSDSEVNIRSVEVTTGTPAIQEVQAVDIGVLAGRAGEMVFSYLGAAAPGVPLGASATEIQAALNAMTAVNDAGGVTVTGAVGGPFTITFNLPGDQFDVFTVTATGFAGTSVGGKILSAGSINNVSIAGAVETIRAGSAADGQSFDFFPKFLDATGRIVNTPGGDGTFRATASDGKAGASISNLVVDRLGVLASGVGSIIAGDGGEGGAGGYIKQVEIRNDSDGFTILSGAGGDGGAVKKKGGAGGLVSNIYIDGVSDDSGNSLITIGAGDGGDASPGNGGIGGALTNVYVGFRLLNKNPLPTESPLRDNLFIFSGEGGDGKVGGKGGAITNLNALVSAPDIVGDEIVVISGNGGDGSGEPRGRGGVGGSITKSVVRNVDFSFGHDLLVVAGSGGDSSSAAPGAAGGLIQSLTTVGREITVFAGDGSDGKSGGAGGALKSITFDQLSGIFPTAVVLGGGVGGDATSSTGGKGGDVTTVRLGESDLTLFDLNPGNSGNGGLSDTGRGGNGGIVKDIQASDVDRGVGKASLSTNLFAVRAGDGGDGGKAGGTGGSITTIAFDGNQIAMDISAGSGGNALTKGAGGAGGSVASAALSVEGQVYQFVAGVSKLVNAGSDLAAGTGGEGAGTAGKGGVGGNVTSVNLRTPGDGSIIAGDGGGGTGTGASGRGGNISLTGLYAIFGSAEMIAGDGGTGGAKPAAGGSVTGKSVDSLSSVFGGQNLTLRAGDGASGGAGGSLKFLGYGSFHPENTDTLVPTPLGNILIAAGNGSGSADGRFAGAGGSIIGVNGSVGFTAGTTTTIVAGDGGSTPKKGGAGGSIENFILQRGGNPVTPGVEVKGVELVVEAGDAGDSPSAATGAKGGRINGFTMIDVSQGAVFRHLSAGDGGDAAKKGGAGGAINDVNVLNHDIGLRSGEDYGYNKLGGVFAGAGGAATTPGLGGDVTNVVADSIGSIAAGKNAVPQLANKVSGIYLTGSNLLQIDDLAFQRGFPGGSENDNYPGIPGTTVVYTFGGDSTPVSLEKDASPSVLAEALNALPSIIAAGGVSVTALLPTGYQINFSNAGDRTQITAEEILGLSADEDLGGEADSPLPITETVQGSTELNVREVQTVRIDPLLLGRLTATFEGNSTSFPNASSLLGASGAATLESKLNLMPSMVSAGRVHVVALTSAPANTFQITFDQPGDMPPIDFLGDSLPLGFAAEITPGVGTREVQRFTIFPNAAAGPGGNPQAVVSSFQLSFGSNKTNFLPANSTAASITTALNALPSIIAAGLVDVTLGSATTFETFEVRFRTNGDRVPLHVLNRVTQGPVTSNVGVATTITQGNQAGGISEVQRISVPTTGLFSFAFGSDATPFMQPGTSPLFVAANLNNLPSITNAGGVFVNRVGDYYEITFANPDPQPQITGVAVQQVQTVTEVAPGVALDNVREVQTVTYDPNGTFSVQFPTTLSALETIHGTAAQGEKQVLDLAAVRALPGATFTLSFGAGTTAALASNATAAQIETALDTLSTIPAGGVSVADNGNGVFTVTFAQFANQPGVITGTVSGAETTGEIDGGESPAVIRTNLETALNNLPSVAASGGVTVQIAEGNQMNVIFNTFGNKPSLGALNQVLEQQSLNLLSDGQYTLTFGGSTTLRLPSGSSATDIQTALNGLASIPVGGVTVTGGENDDFVIVFNEPGPVAEITATQFFSLDTETTQEGTAALQERQAVTVPERYLFDPVTFAASNLVGGFSDATDFDPHIFKWIDTDGDGQFETGEQPIDGLVAARSFDQVLTGLITEARFVGGEFTFTETTPGNVATNEVQTLFIKSDKFTLAFEGNETKALPGKTNAAAITKALNALPSIIAAGGVNVSSAGANTFSIAFNLPGDRSPVLAPFFYDFNNIIL